MTKLTDEQKCALQLPMQIGLISPGIRNGLNALVSKNSKYFAFATIVSVYIYEQNPIKLISVLTKSRKTICTISFAPKTPQIIAISYHAKQVAIIHVADNKCISKFETPEVIVSFGWLKLDSELVGFTRFYSNYTIYDVATGQKLRTVNGFFNNIRILAMSSTEDPIFFGGNNKGSVTRIQGNRTKTLEYTTRNYVVASALDPNNELQGLIVWKNSWALYDISTMIKLIHEVTDLTYSLSAACWSSFVPGQFYTGDSVTGIVRIWNASTEQPLEILNLSPHGISSLLDLKRNKLLIGFTDGMVGVYDMEERRFIFQNSPGHSSSIINLSFHPTNPNIVITAGREGSICTWNTNSMKQIDRIHSDSHGKLHSMDISPGGGMICCGYNDGYLMFFNIQTKAKLFEYQVCDFPIEKVNFSLFEPELLIVSTGSGFIAIINIQEGKTIWNPPKEYKSHFGFFSPHNKDQFFITTTNSFFMVYNERTQRPAITFAETNNSTIISLAFSNFDKDIVAATYLDGSVTIFNLAANNMTKISDPSSLAMKSVFHPTIEGIIASAGKKGIITLYDYKAGKNLCEFRAHASSILAFDFSPAYPTLLITSASDSSIKFWSIDRLFVKQFLTNIIDMKPDWARQLEGSVQLFKLAKRCLKTGDKMKFNTNDAVHINDILRLTKKTVQKTMSSSMHETSLIRQAVKNKKRLIEAAKLELFMGNPKHYCEMIFASGDFDLAVSAAPAVSVNFWIEMMKNRAKLYDDGDEEKARIKLLIGDIEGAVDTLIEQNRSTDAFLIHAAKNKGAFNFTPKPVTHQTIVSKHPYIDTVYSNNDLYTEYKMASKQAKQCLMKGQIDCAASAYLSVSDVVSAEMRLLRHGETASAFLLDALTDTKNPIVREKFALMTIQSGSKKKLFEVLTEDEKKKFVVAIHFANETKREEFFTKVGLKKPAEYDVPGQNDYEKVHNFLLAGKQNEACEFVLSKLDGLSSHFCEIEDLVKLLQIADLSNATENLRFSIASLSVYFGIYKALWKGYKKILDKLQNSLASCIKSHNLSSLSQLANETQTAISLSKEKMEVAQLYYVGYDFLNVQKVGTGYKAASKYGKQYTLEDGVTKMNMEEALMWFDVTPFSPLSLNVRHYII